MFIFYIYISLPYTQVLVHLVGSCIKDSVINPHLLMLGHIYISLPYTQVLVHLVGSCTKDSVIKLMPITLRHGQMLSITVMLKELISLPFYRKLQ